MLHQLITEKLAMEPRTHERLAMLVLADKIDFNKIQLDRQSPYIHSYEDDYDYYGSSDSVYNSIPKIQTKHGQVAVIPLQGTMSRNGDYCSWGTSDIAAWMLEAYQDPNICGIVMDCNSGGGAVDGTELLAEVFRQRNKPVVSHVTGMAASACYWVISQGDWINMESAAASEVGSIGVLAMHIDSSQAYEKAGYKVTIIRSEGSENKALFNTHEPLSDELVASVKAEMKPIRATFITDVKSGRPLITDEKIFDGGMYNGKAAVANKMADSIGFIGDAINQVSKLQSKYKSQNKAA